MIDINKVQQRASNPLSSVWVSASAGSGKTKVLSDRVLNLLLLNGKPEKILCLTFTKAAAAEMSNRINKILKDWAVLNDDELASHIELLTGEFPENETILKARRLFAQVLETPGGMKIMTIHSFCQSILKRFPIEANVPPHFDILDDNAVQAILSQALDNVLSQPEFLPDIQLLAKYQSLDRLITLLKDFLTFRIRLLELIKKNSLENIIFEIKKNFNIEKYDTEIEIIKESFDENEWEYIKTKNLKKNGMPIKRKEDDPTAILASEVAQKIRNFKLVHLTKALLKIAYRILELYQHKKQSSALLDYNDLIHSTKNLLEKNNASAWVLFKLDGGIDHILVDEAQDTNPDQWSIIQHLAEEFFSGEDHHDSIRTIFAVGDKKQSIYSFQGADPEEFERMKLFFQNKVQESENNFEIIPFNLSFRSTKPILHLVNHVLNNTQARKGVLFPNEDGTHTAFRNDDAGLVEIWPLEKAFKTDEAQPWKPPVERIQNQSSLSRLAEKVANKINAMIQNKTILESEGRPVVPGDFLILVQRRNQFVSEIVRLLKEKSIPVAGIDRLNLGKHIAIQDLIAAAKFALLTEDDLNLACLLKSPLVKMSEDDLFKVSYNRKGKSLWERVQSLYPEKAFFLNSILNQADKIPPYEFFSYILGPLHGRKNFIARLGSEVNEALDEFLNLILSFEKNEIPSLQHFIDWMNNQDKIEIKRDMESNQSAVRIMTVHGSKGLQGNIVFLPQTRYISRKRSPFLWINDLPLWLPNKEMSSLKTDQVIEQLDEAEDDENRRLLYVALTRARDQLYICGYENLKNVQANNWYDLIVNSISELYTPDKDDIIRITSPQKKIIQKAENNEIVNPIQHLPNWAYQQAPVDKKEFNVITPSSSQLTEISYSDSIVSSEINLAREKGIFIHKLLQYLPTIPHNQWETAINRLNCNHFDIPENLFELLSSPEFKDIFSKNSFAEVPVIGFDGQNKISGQIDRLVIREKEVWIIDFKTGQNVPDEVSLVPKSYVNQLTLYKKLIKNIFPDKVIRTYLLWTENLKLMEIY